MSDELADHVAALILEAVRSQGDSYSAFVEDLQVFLERAYQLEFSREVIDHALGRLERLEGVQRFSSSLAGEMIEISVSRSLQYYGDDARVPSSSTSMEYDQRFEVANKEYSPLKAYSFGGKRWVDRVVANLARGNVPEISPISEDVVAVSAPASDRIVSISDNQRDDIDEAAQELSGKIAKENSIDGDVDLRGRFLAQIAAARELIRAESVRVYLVYETLVRLLGTLIEKYKGQAIGEAAKKLLGLLIEHIFGK